MQKRFGRDSFSYMPETHIHPTNRRALHRSFHSSPPNTIWIIKPPASARGNGIKLVSKWSHMPTKGREAVVSRYISNPYLIMGRKFDIRLYVVVTGWDPLRVYLFEEGVVRFASEGYKRSTAHKDLRRRLVHLTNYSISKRAKRLHGADEEEKMDDETEFDVRDRKWSLKTLKKYLTTQNISFPKIWSSINDVILKTMLSVHMANSSGVKMHVPSRTNCYELFGFDILLDSHLKPWLLEVNISPSLKYSCPTDYDVKSRMCADLLNLVGVRVGDVRGLRRFMGGSGGRSGKRPRGGVLAGGMGGAGIRQQTTTTTAQERMRRRREFTANFLAELTEYDLEILKEVENE
ncbi:Tubulin polyglutamylase ttll4, partial [Rhizophlyctis rosea]